MIRPNKKNTWLASPPACRFLSPLNYLKNFLCKSLRFTVLNSLIFEILLVFRRPSRYILIDRSAWAWVQGSYIKMAALATSVQKIITDIAGKPPPPPKKYY
jgi:hypothetical protein